MTPRQINALAKKIARDLFQNVNGDHASRLVLELPDGHDGGGWGQDAMAVRIAAHLTKALGDKPEPKGKQ